MKTIILIAVFGFSLSVHAPATIKMSPIITTKATGAVKYQVVATVMTSKNGSKLATGQKNTANTLIFVALPCKSALRKTVTVFSPQTNKTIKNVPVLDVGPWSTKDPYWKTHSRPLAESYKSNKYKKTTNTAGIDLSLALCNKLGLKYPYKGIVEWNFE